MPLRAERVCLGAPGREVVAAFVDDGWPAGAHKSLNESRNRAPLFLPLSPLPPPLVAPPPIVLKSTGSSSQTTKPAVGRPVVTAAGAGQWARQTRQRCGCGRRATAGASAVAELPFGFQAGGPWMFVLWTGCWTTSQRHAQPHNKITTPSSAGRQVRRGAARSAAGRWRQARAHFAYPLAQEGMGVRGRRREEDD